MLEVKVIEGHGTTIDVVLVNGVLHEGDQIVVCGLQVCSNLLHFEGRIKIIIWLSYLLYRGPLLQLFEHY